MIQYCDMAKVGLTREEFEVVINNYRNQGLDTRELEMALETAYPMRGNPRMQLPLPRRAKTGPTLDELKQQAVITKGNCSICGKSGRLYSGTCEECFNSWASSIAER